MEARESQPSILLDKIREQVGLAQQLMSLIPAGALEWSPPISDRSPLLDSGDYAPPNQGSALSHSTDVAGGGVSEAPREAGSQELLRLGDLLGHLLDCMAGFCALLYTLNKRKLAHFSRLRSLEVNHFCGTQEALARTREYMSHIEEGFRMMEDTDLTRLVPTVFVPKGEPVLTLLLGNLEHLINHKYQLFIYLRLLGVRVGTRDLYRFRAPASTEQPAGSLPQD